MGSEMCIRDRSIRMVPLAGVFQKMNRIVRDMKKKLNKDVEFVMEGEDTEVDKSIVDSLQDPLMHLVRNCMDHGIEEHVEERTAEGKPAKGTVKLTAQLLRASALGEAQSLQALPQALRKPARKLSRNSVR